MSELTKNDPITEFYSHLVKDYSENKQSLYELILEKQAELGVSNLQMANILGMDKTTFNRKMQSLKTDGGKSVDFYTILKICQLLGIEVEDMSKLFVSQLTSQQIGEIEQSRKANYIISNFDIKGLKEVGFIDNKASLETIENRIKSFFGLDSIFQYKIDVGAVAFKTTKTKHHDKMREFWVRSAHFQFEKFDNPNEFSMDSLKVLIPRVFPYTRYVEKGLLNVIQSLYNIGVTVIIQTYLPKSQVKGGSFVVNGKPCIVLSDHGKSYPHLWFSLMHELYHVWHEFKQLEAWKYHLTGEPQSELYLFREDYADLFGWEMLFPKEKRSYINTLIKSENYVYNYAKENMVHPGIIYAAYCEDTLIETKRNEYSFYQHHFGKSDKAVQAIKMNPWNKKTIVEEIEEKKKLYTLQTT